MLRLLTDLEIAVLAWWQYNSRHTVRHKCLEINLYSFSITNTFHAAALTESQCDNTAAGWYT